jgi:hypothetical protein
MNTSEPLNINIEQLIREARLQRSAAIGASIL